MRLLPFVIVPALFVVAGCPGGELGEGSLRVSVNGEEAATDGFAASDLADGWSVSFDDVLVSLEHIAVGPEDGEEQDLEAESVINLASEMDP